MYIPRHFEQPDVETMHALLRAHPLATLVTQRDGGLYANHIPLHLVSSVGPYGVLQGHVARANPILQDFNGQGDVLAVFHGPQGYISPSWYATKQDTGKVVPTWNYVVVHAHGLVSVVDDAHWLRAQLDALTRQNEATFAHPWDVSDAPVEYTDKMIGNIVGFELVITRLSGKWKVSQNQPPKNRASVIEGLTATGQLAMAALVAQGTD